MFLFRISWYLETAKAVLKSKRLWKLVGISSIAGLVWFSIYQFNLNYQFVNSQGIHGIVARKTMQAMSASADKASAYDTIPDNYMNILQRFDAPVDYTY